MRLGDNEGNYLGFGFSWGQNEGLVLGLGFSWVEVGVEMMKNSLGLGL